MITNSPVATLEQLVHLDEQSANSYPHAESASELGDVIQFPTPEPKKQYTLAELEQMVESAERDYYALFDTPAYEANHQQLREQLVNVRKQRDALKRKESRSTNAVRNYATTQLSSDVYTQLKASSPDIYSRVQKSMSFLIEDLTGFTLESQKAKSLKWKDRVDNIEALAIHLQSYLANQVTSESLSKAQYNTIWGDVKSMIKARLEDKELRRQIKRTKSADATLKSFDTLLAKIESPYNYTRKGDLGEFYVGPEGAGFKLKYAQPIHIPFGQQAGKLYTCVASNVPQVIKQPSKFQQKFPKLHKLATNEVVMKAALYIGGALALFGGNELRKALPELVHPTYNIIATDDYQSKMLARPQLSAHYSFNSR
ncbi:MAG TPA: hypothetical protein VK158_03155 [Acidobacteriota bacterium]|nr:hypothetical protein [Acidobacteriota bacterium]